jgi:hypothetical protein
MSGLPLLLMYCARAPGRGARIAPHAFLDHAVGVADLRDQKHHVDQRRMIGNDHLPRTAQPFGAFDVVSQHAVRYMNCTCSQNALLMPRAHDAGGSVVSPGSRPSNGSTISTRRPVRPIRTARSWRRWRTAARRSCRRLSALAGTLPVPSTCLPYVLSVGCVMQRTQKIQCMRPSALAPNLRPAGPSSQFQQCICRRVRRRMYFPHSQWPEHTKTARRRSSCRRLMAAFFGDHDQHGGCAFSQQHRASSMACSNVSASPAMATDSPRWPRRIDHCPAIALCTERPNLCGRQRLVIGHVAEQGERAWRFAVARGEHERQLFVSPHKGHATCMVMRASRLRRRRCMAGRKSQAGLLVAMSCRLSGLACPRLTQRFAKAKTVRVELRRLAQQWRDAGWSMRKSHQTARQSHRRSRLNSGGTRVRQTLPYRLPLGEIACGVEQADVVGQGGRDRLQLPGPHGTCQPAGPGLTMRAEAP